VQQAITARTGEQGGRELGTTVAAGSGFDAHEAALSTTAGA
jgi:hypothetical protein